MKLLKRCKDCYWFCRKLLECACPDCSSIRKEMCLPDNLICDLFEEETDEMQVFENEQ